MASPLAFTLILGKIREVLTMIDNKDRIRWLHRSIDECLYTLERTKSQVKLLHKEVEDIGQNLSNSSSANAESPNKSFTVKKDKPSTTKLWSNDTHNI